jgi:hypothetical protein
MAKPEVVSAGISPNHGRFGQNKTCRQGLIAESRADGDALAADGAAAAEYGCPGLGLHASAEAMGFHAFASIGLKCALGHENGLLFPEKSSP